MKAYTANSACPKCGQRTADSHYVEHDNLIGRTCSRCCYRWGEKPLDVNSSPNYIDVKFQEGPIKDVGVNGCQAQDVITFIVRYLRECNAVLSCRETSIAITKLEEARLWLDERTRRRVEQSVEGTMQPHQDGMPVRS
jgi:Zn ribbon nucleic-acid-binding protein